MSIQEAAKLALELNIAQIYRMSCPDTFIQPTDQPDCCIISNDYGRSSPRWEPQLGDLLADDWFPRGIFDESCIMAMRKKAGLA